MRKLRRTLLQWRPQDVKHALAVVRETIAETMALGLEPQQARIEAMLAEIEALDGRVDSDVLSRRFALALSVLHWHARGVPLTDARANGLLDITRTIVELGYSGDRRSLGAQYLAAYYEVQGALAARAGNNPLALWMQQAAVQIVPDTQEPGRGVHLTLLGLRALRTGHLSLALQALHAAEMSLELPQAVRVKTRIGLVQALRLSGDRRGALALLKEADQGDVAAWTSAAHWERLVLDLCAGGSMLPMLQALSGKTCDVQVEQAFGVLLWGRAVRSREWLKRLPKAVTIRGKFKAEVRASDSLKLVIKGIQALEDFYDNTLPLDRRCEDLGGVIASAGYLPTIEMELLFLAAGARALIRANQSLLAAGVVARYQGESLRLTAGATGDALGILDDIVGRGWVGTGEGEAPSDTEAALEELRALGGSSLARVGRLGLTLGGIATSALSAKVKLTFTSRAEQERLRQKEMENIGARLVGALGQMKGLGTKLGQALGFCADILPESMRATLALLHDQGPTLPPARVRATVEAELGRSIDDLFAVWVDEPIAAGSIGQVHRAQLHDGTWVAIKLQYPGIAAALLADVGVLEMVRPFASMLFPRARVGEILEEVRALVLSECDYVSERQNIERFRAIFAGHEQIVIPATIPELCTAGVLTTEYLDGLNFDAFARSASSDDKNAIGGLIFKFMYTSMLRRGLIYGDPQPGNFLVTADGRLGVVDFGCVKEWNEATRKTYAAYMQAALAGDRVAVAKRITELGMVADPDRFDFDAEWDTVMRHYLKPMVATELFRYSTPFVKELASKSLLKHPNRRHGTVPKDLVILARLTWGMSYLLAMLEAQNDWRGLILAILAESLNGDGRRIVGESA